MEKILKEYLDSDTYSVVKYYVKNIKIKKKTSDCLTKEKFNNCLMCGKKSKSVARRVYHPLIDGDRIPITYKFIWDGCDPEPTKNQILNNSICRIGHNNRAPWN